MYWENKTSIFQSLLLGSLKAPLGTLACSALLLSTANAQTKVYTLDADFDEGVLLNVNHDAPNNDQLQINEVTQTFPILWIANAGEDTVSKIDTNTNKEIARYRTWFGPAGQAGHFPHPNNGFAGAAPSRTAVDASGNVYVANREFRNLPPTVLKILASGFIDRNGNGTLDTSVDIDNSGVIGDAAGELLPLADTNGNSAIDPSEIQDERIAWAMQFPTAAPSPRLARSVSIDNNGDIWIGMYTSRTYYKISGATGAILVGPIAASGPDQNQVIRTNSPYGALVDSNGKLWGASLTNNLIKLDTLTDTVDNVFIHSGSDYGIAIGNGKVYKGSAATPFLVFDPVTELFSSPNPSGFFSSTLGISVEGSGDIFTGSSNGGVGVIGSWRGASKFRPDSSLIWTNGAQPGATGGSQRGAIPDSNNDVWTVQPFDDNVSKFRGTDGLPLGVIPVGDYPYTYSDASGSSFLAANPQGTWEAVFDTLNSGQSDCTVSYSGSTPGGATITLEVDNSDIESTIVQFADNVLTEISNGGTVPGTGRYIYVKTTLKAGGTNNSDKPILNDLTINCSSQEPICGDLDSDGDVDSADRAILIGALTTSVGDAGFIPAADFDGDGQVTYNDYREWYICYRQYVLSQPL